MPASSSEAPRRFPTTRVSIVVAAGSDDPDARRRAFETLIKVYWRPVYSHLRLKWRRGREDAEDLTQEFLSRAVAQGFFNGYDPDRGRFRTFLRGCLDHFAANARRDEQRLKRGGGLTHLPLDFEGAEHDLALADGTAADPDARFQQEWVRGLFAAAVDALREQSEAGGHDIRFQVFRRHDLEPVLDRERPSYRALAEEFGLPVTQVTNHLAWARRELRRLVLEQLQALSGSEAEFRAEAKELFGVDLR